MKIPPWDKAPEWANYATRNWWGIWTFWKNKPNLASSPICNHPMWQGRGERITIGKPEGQYDNEDWWEKVEVRH